LPPRLTPCLHETRTYNTNLQVTNVTSGGYNFTYNYSATQNNGKIQSMTDAISGETITYQYDTLNRLASASGTGDPNGQWSQTFTYDGFGNLVAKAGNNAPNNITINVNPATNQLTGNGALYDSVGNLLQYGSGTPEQSYSYDVENRLTQVTANSVVTMYGYDTRNERIYSGPQTVGCGSAEKYFFYGVDGKKLAVITAQWTTTGTCYASPITVTQTNVWFAGRLLVPQDRLNSHGKYFPYGEDRTNPNPTNPANGVEKYATYTRDAESGLDYAYQRYYTSGLGRFLTADPYDGSAGPYNPQSWNRYPYAGNDPADNNDSAGLDCGGQANWYGLCGPGLGQYGFDPSQFGDATDSGATGSGPCVNIFGAAVGCLANVFNFPTGGTTRNGSTTGSSTMTTYECNSELESDIFAYLYANPKYAAPAMRQKVYSPLIPWIATIVADSFANDVDPRFIVALACAESSCGVNLTWGPYNAWNNSNHRAPWPFNKPSYTGWADAIADVTRLIGGRSYIGAGLLSTGPIPGDPGIYPTYQGPGYVTGLNNLNTALQAMGGNIYDVRNPCE